MRITQKVLVLTLILGMVFSQSVYAGTLSMKLDGNSHGSPQKSSISIDVKTVQAGLENGQYISNSATAAIQIKDRATGKKIRLVAEGSAYAVPEDAARKNGVGSFFGFSDQDGIDKSGDEYTVSFTMYQNWYQTGQKSYKITIEKYNRRLDAYKKVYEAPLTELRNGIIRVNYSE